MIDEIHSALNRALQERGLDRRTCYVEVRADPPEGRRIVVESSDPGVLSDVARILPDRALAVEADVRLTVLPAPGEVFPEVLIAAGSVADVRRTPSHAAELVTQIVCGDRVSPLKTNGDWVLVRLDDAYIGWVRSWHLKGVSRSDSEAFALAARYRIRENVVSVRGEPQDDARPAGEAVSGTPCIAGDARLRGWRRIELPDGCAGYVRSRSIGRIGPARPLSRDRLVACAMSFLGVPYVWGGTTPKGFDCSGLVQRVFRLSGALLPRDSDQQAHAGRGKSTGRIDELEGGDLLFFGKSVNQITHVAIYASDGLFVHARGQVRLNSLVPTHPLFDQRLVGEWRVTRDVIGR